MTRLVDQVRAPDGRVVGIRCASCGLVFANRATGDWRTSPAQQHADHTWQCPERAKP